VPTRKSDAYRHSGKTMRHFHQTVPTAAIPSNCTLGLLYACVTEGQKLGIWGPKIVRFGERK